MSQKGQKRFREKQSGSPFLPNFCTFILILTLPPELSSIFFCFLKYQEGSKALDTYNSTKVNFVPWAQGLAKLPFTGEL